MGGGGVPRSDTDIGTRWSTARVGIRRYFTHYYAYAIRFRRASYHYSLVLISLVDSSVLFLGFSEPLG